MEISLCKSVLSAVKYSDPWKRLDGGWGRFLRVGESESRYLVAYATKTTDSGSLTVNDIFVKRCFDLIFVLALAPVWIPLMLVLAVVVRLSMGPPVFFRQLRPGLGGGSFSLLKFRTMLEKRDSKGQMLPDDQRMTSFGRWLRSTSLDELPELLNVLRGEMSLVGPRPLLVQYLERYTPEQSRRHEVLPGITGWAQINGRNAISWEEKFTLDVWYVDNRSLWLDVKILLMTLMKVFLRHGINAADDTTMPEFRGAEVGKNSATKT